MTTLAYGNKAGFPAVIEGRVWAPTRTDRTVVPIDPERMRLAPAVNLDAEPGQVVAAAGSIWVLASNPSLLYRIDPKTSELLGAPLPVPDGAQLLAYGAGSLWIDDPKEKGLVRLTPADPAPAAHPEGATDELMNGPVHPHVRLHERSVEPHFSIEVPGEGWVAEGIGAGLPQFELVRRKGSGVTLSVAKSVFDRSGRLATVRTPAAFLHALQSRHDLRINHITAVSLSGAHGLRATIVVTPKAPYPSLCGGSPCVVLFPLTRGTYILQNGEDEFTVVKRGPNLLVIDESLGQHPGPNLLKRLRALVDSVRFER